MVKPTHTRRGRNNFPEGTRVCTGCGETKPLDDFPNSANGGAHDGKMPKCKPCQSAIQSAYRKQYQIDHPDIYAARKLKQRVRNMGLTVEQFHEMEESQHGLCAICGKPNLIADHKRLTIDHDHDCCPGKYSCGKCVRGLLCGSCNHGLGAFKDDVAIMQKAVEYLLSYS